jgi:hypothetical protein
MLASPFALRDVDDVENFVAATINRALPGLDESEFEELKLEGLAIMCELHKKFEPRREGYQQDGRFSGFAAMYLPRKLGDAWHRLHPEHRYVTDPESGRRSWIYDQAPVSLDGIAERAMHQSGQRQVMGNGFDQVLHTARRPNEFVPIRVPSGAAGPA